MKPSEADLTQVYNLELVNYSEPVPVGFLAQRLGPLVREVPHPLGAGRRKLLQGIAAEEASLFCFLRLRSILLAELGVASCVERRELSTRSHHA